MGPFFRTDLLRRVVILSAAGFQAERRISVLSAARRKPQLKVPARESGAFSPCGTLDSYWNRAAANPEGSWSPATGDCEFGVGAPVVGSMSKITNAELRLEPIVR